MANVIEVRRLYDQLLKEIELFNEIWPKHMVSGAVYQLPIMQKVQAALPTYIPVRKITGNEVLEQARSAFIQVKRISSEHEGQEQNPASCFRLPGWIAVSRDLSKEIAELNLLKKELGDYLRTVSVQTRPDFNRKALPGVSILQLLREIRIASTPTPHRMCFTWASAGSLRTVVPREKAIALMQRRKSYPEEGTSAEEWAAMLDERIQQVKDSPSDSDIIRKRQHAPHPRVLIYPERGSVSFESITATLPTFVYCPSDTDKPFPKIRDLKVLDRAASMKISRKKRRPISPLVPGLGLYTRLRSIETQEICKGDCHAK